MRPSKIKVNQIRIDGGTQPRAAINEDTVAEYAERMTAGDAFPPLVVFYDGAEHWLADGFHRWHAANKAGVETINAHVRQGSRQDAVWHAVSCNGDHGLRRTNADKRKAVEMALRAHPEMSDRAIADHVGVHFNTVANHRRDLAASLAITNCDSRVGLDGKTYDTSNIGKSATDVGGGVREETATAGETQPADRVSATRDGSPAPAPMVDQVGQKIDKSELATQFLRRQEIQNLMTLLTKVKRSVEKGIEDEDPLFAEVNLNQVKADLENARSHLRLKAMPHAVCLRCGGRGDDCIVCLGRGWISEFGFRNEPAELKSHLTTGNPRRGPPG